MTKKTPIDFWSINKDIRDEIIKIFPPLANTNSKLNKLAWFVVDKFSKDCDEIPASRNWMHKMTDTNKNNNTTWLLEQLQLELNNLFDIKSYYHDISGQNSQCRVLTVNKDSDVYKKLVAIYRPTDWETPRVSLLTGKEFKYTKKPVETRRKKVKEMKISLVTEYQEKESLPSMLDYADLVNELVDNKARANKLNSNIKKAYLSVIEQGNLGLLEEKQVKAYRESLLRYRDFVNITTYELKKDNSPRIFDYLDQNLPRMVREIVYDGCYDLDLKRSQLTILASLAGDDGLELAQSVIKPAFWEDFIDITDGITKKRLKNAIYAVMYGGNDETLKSDPDIKFSDKELFMFKSTLVYKHVKQALNAVHRKLRKDNGVFFGDYFMQLNEPFNINELTCRYIQWIESMVIFTICKEIKEDKEISLMGAYHDGVLVAFEHPDRYLSKLAKLNKVAQDEARKHGIKNVQLEIK